MFKQRLLTALVLLPFVFWLVLAAKLWVFAIFLTLIVLLAAWEWGQLIPLKSKLHRGLYCVLLALVLLWFYFDVINITAYLQWGTAGLIALVAGFLAEVSYPRTRIMWAYPPVIILLGILLLSGCWWSLMQLKLTRQGEDYLLYLLFMVWAADTGAYVIGKLWGKHKLIPKVSPGKTYQGLCGGIFSSAIITIIAGYLFAIPTAEWSRWAIVGLLASISTVVGDLLVSMLKRNVNLKDTGHILPGHGGMLDRIDSVIAAGIVFTVTVLYFKIL